MNLDGLGISTVNELEISLEHNGFLLGDVHINRFFSLLRVKFSYIRIVWNLRYIGSLCWDK